MIFMGFRFVILFSKYLQLTFGAWRSADIFVPPVHLAVTLFFIRRPKYKSSIKLQMLMGVIGLSVFLLFIVRENLYLA